VSPASGADGDDDRELLDDQIAYGSIATVA